MTHDELLKTLREDLSTARVKLAKQPYLLSLIVKAYRQLISVVELHKPAFACVDGVKGPEWCYQCAEGRGYAKWPCPTIQAIEKELG